MDFQVKVGLPAGLPPVNRTERILLIGSRSAENVDRLLAEDKFRVDVSPFGILYNPLSVSMALVGMLKGKVYQEGDLFLYKECWCSPIHHGLSSASSPEEVLEKISTRLLQAHRSVHELDWLMLAFSITYMYERKETRQIVFDCHKLPESCLNRRTLSVDGIMNEYTSLITNMVTRNSYLKVLFTVSPIRYTRDGTHANQLGRSTLLLAIDCLQQPFPDHAFYSPSHEIALDELRDYHHHANDMPHPSPLAVRYLWGRFSKTFFFAGTKQVITAIEDITKDLSHKPFHPESEAYQRFLEQIVLRIERLNGKYPYLDFQKETELCHIRLNP